MYSSRRWSAGRRRGHPENAEDPRCAAQTLGDSRAAEYMKGRKTLEINPDHPIVQALKDKVDRDAAGAKVRLPCQVEDDEGHALPRARHLSLNGEEEVLQCAGQVGCHSGNDCDRSMRCVQGARYHLPCGSLVLHVHSCAAWLYKSQPSRQRLACQMARTVWGMHLVLGPALLRKLDMLLLMRPSASCTCRRSQS